RQENPHFEISPSAPKHLFPTMSVSTTTCYPEFMSGTVYSQDAQVSFNGINYVAKWWQSGSASPDQRGDGGWSSEGECHEAAVLPACYTAFVDGTVYVTDDQVSFDGANFVAKWYQDGKAHPEKPGDGGWSKEGACTTGTVSSAIPVTSFATTTASTTTSIVPTTTAIIPPAPTTTSIVPPAPTTAEIIPPAPTTASTTTRKIITTPPPAVIAPSPTTAPAPAPQPTTAEAPTNPGTGGGVIDNGSHPDIPFNEGGSPGSGANYVTSWHWFVGNSFDCDGSITAEEYNTGFYAGSENIPAGCGTTGTFTYNGNSVTVKFIWRTTGGSLYHELSAAAFAQLIGSGAQVSPGMSSTDFQIAINDPGRVVATCSGAGC
ncbi:hypothetical protein HDU98_012213, partial [Podochytrium sp. JEL0797]